MSCPLILVVDDDPDVRALLARALGAAGFAVDQAGTGAEGIAAARARTPSLVLLDYQLPDTDGPAVTRAVKAERPDVPVILLTASQDAAHVEEAFLAGADDYVTKPVNARIVVTRVRSTLQGLEDRLAGQRAERLARERDSLAHDLAEARRVQASQLPALPVRAGAWAIDGAMTPCTAVGGDLAGRSPWSCRRTTSWRWRGICARPWPGSGWC